MYSIQFYGWDIFDDQLQELFPIEAAVLELDVNTAGKLTVTIPYDHPNYDKLQKLKLGMTVKKNGTTIFKGRITKDTRDFYYSKSIECEGKLAVLNDSIRRPYEFTGSPADYFTELIENHNSMMDDEKKFIVGNITVTDPNDYIARSSTDYKTSWELIKSLIDSLGGYLFIRYEEDGDYIDWVEDFQYTNLQKIQFAENLLDLIIETTTGETYTACIPLGATIENDESNEESGIHTGNRLTVESVNDGSDIVYNAEKVAEYGWKFPPAAMVTWDDVTRPENLLTKAENWLNYQGIMIASTVELTAADLAYSDQDINSFEWLQYVQVESEPHGIDVSWLLAKIKIDMLDPENGKISLGDSQQTLYDAFRATDGKPGKDGDPGADGKSAYEIWLEAGNSGTEEEYLASLKGEPGADGASVESITRYYLLQSSDLESPEKPTVYPPGDSWTTTEPAYEEGSANTLYYVDYTQFSDESWMYSEVSKDTSYEAAKAADTKIDSETAAIREEIVEQSSYILETAEKITMGILAGYTTASDLETYKKEIENLFSASEEGFSFEFSQLQSQLSALDNKIVEQKQYIRMENGEIYIGRSDSLITSVYTNDSLEFRYNGHRVARFTNEVLEVRNISTENQVAFFEQWATRKGAYIDGVGYNLNDMWIGG